VRTRFVFLLAFVVYVLGPARAPGREAQGPVAKATGAPFVALARVVYPLVPPADQERWAGRAAGAFYAAGAVALTFAALGRLASPEAALILAAAAALGSPLWSWGSRGSNVEAPGALLMAAVLWLSFRSRPVPWRAIAAVAALALVVALAQATTPAAEGTSVVQAFDTLAFAAYLVAPGRGLLLFIATSVLALVGLWRGDAFVRGAGIVVLAVVAEIASRPDPWDPLAFGPALLTPLVPLLAVMAARLPLEVLRIGLLWTLPLALLHGIAVFRGGHTWDERRGLPAHPDAVWDTHDTPFRDLLLGPPEPDLRALVPRELLVSGGTHATRAGEEAPWLVYGWEPPEAQGTWASGPRSWIVVAAPPGEFVLTLTATAPALGTDRQRLTIARPGYPPLEFAFTKGLWEYERVVVPFQSTQALSLIELRPAYVARPGRGDVRPLTLFVAGLSVEPVRRVP